jgi:hypothetical protein
MMEGNFWCRAGSDERFRAATFCRLELSHRLGVVFLAFRKLGIWEGVAGKVVTCMSKLLIQHQDQRQTPWNKGRLVGHKRPLTPKEVWNKRFPAAAFRTAIIDNRKDQYSPIWPSLNPNSLPRRKMTAPRLPIDDKKCYI